LRVGGRQRREGAEGEGDYEPDCLELYGASPVDQCSSSSGVKVIERARGPFSVEVLPPAQIMGSASGGVKNYDSLPTEALPGTTACHDRDGRSSSRRCLPVIAAASYTLGV
jgi:hypothetical protein